MRLALFVVGLLLIPVCSGLMRMLHVLAVHYPAKAAVPILSLSAPVGAFLIGALLFTTIFMVVRFPAAPYIWVHELTHALFGLLSGSTVSRLVVDKEHGSVDITSPTMIGLLAPYFFPLPALAFLLLSSLLSFALPVGGTVAGAVCSGIFGFLWGFHGCFTLNALLQYQEDLDTYGFFFSVLFLTAMNLLVLCIALAAYSPIGWGAFFRELFLTQTDTFVFLWNGAWTLLAA